MGSRLHTCNKKNGRRVQNIIPIVALPLDPLPSFDDSTYHQFHVAEF
jgi:hypothetical protein